MNKNQEYFPAIRLINTPDGSSTFEKGRLPVMKTIATTSFRISNTVEEWEKGDHPAPRKQYVVTVKGKIRFEVSNGETFLIEPGIILLAEDVEGKGHSWEFEEGEIWERLYIPIPDYGESFFIPDHN